MPLPQNPLLQPDILRCILDYFAVLYGKEIKEARRALAASARTCHALSEPALDKLWSSLNSLEPLARCYPYEDNENVPTPTPTNWATIRRYSHRIKELKLSPLDQVSSRFLQAISSQPRLFPNIRRVSWRSFTREANSSMLRSIALLQSFIGPSLDSLHLYTHSMDAAVLQALQSLFTNLSCSNLTSLVIFIGMRQPGSLGSLYLPSPVCDGLGCLHLSVPIDDVALRHIIMSPRLKELGLVLNPDQSRLCQVHLPSGMIPFYNANDLSLEVWDLQFITSLLRDEGQILHSFLLTLHSRPTLVAFSGFLTALGSRQRIHSLQSVTLRSTYRESAFDRTAVYAPLYDALRPLTCLPHLAQLSIQLNSFSPMNDDELASLAHHWPHLSSLLLRPPVLHGRPWKSGKYITLRGLTSLVECCPRLWLLYLPLDAREVPTDIPNGSICTSPLRSIRFFDSPINDPELVAAFLSQQFHAFPAVSSVFAPRRGDDDEISGYKAAWDRVRQISLEQRPRDRSVSEPVAGPVLISWTGS